MFLKLLKGVQGLTLDVPPRHSLIAFQTSNDHKVTPVLQV